jgi:hypothetical protein
MLLLYSYACTMSELVRVEPLQTSMTITISTGLTQSEAVARKRISQLLLLILLCVCTDEESAQRAVLLTPEENLTPAAAAIFTQWFYDYAEMATETVETVTDEHDAVSADTAAAAVSAIVATGDAADVTDTSTEPEFYLTRHGIAAFIHSCCKRVVLLYTAVMLHIVVACNSAVFSRAVLVL